VVHQSRQSRYSAHWSCPPTLHGMHGPLGQNIMDPDMNANEQPISETLALHAPTAVSVSAIRVLIGPPRNRSTQKHAFAQQRAGNCHAQLCLSNLMWGATCGARLISLRRFWPSVRWWQLNIPTFPSMPFTAPKSESLPIRCL